MLVSGHAVVNTLQSKSLIAAMPNFGTYCIDFGPSSIKANWAVLASQMGSCDEIEKVSFRHFSLINMIQYASEHTNNSGTI